MLPEFSWSTFIINALHLSSGAPDDPNILGQFMTQVTGHQFIMVDTNTSDSQNNINPVSSSIGVLVVVVVVVVVVYLCHQ